jgi:hypothetical protein
VAAQANDFLTGPPEPDRGYFGHLMRASKDPFDLDIAFLLTRPATGRAKVRTGDHESIRNTYDQPTTDGGAGEFSRFRDRMMTRMLVRAGDLAVIESQGVHSWSHDKGSYKVARNFRIGAPEAVLDMILQTESTEAESEGQLRQWFVNLLESPIKSKKLTPLGKVVDELREQSSQFLENKWRPSLADGKGFADFTQSDKSDWKRLFPDLADGPKQGANPQREFYRNQARDHFAGQSKMNPFVVHFDPSGWPLWGLDEKGRFWIDHPIRLTLEGKGELPSAWVEATLRACTKEPFDPAKVTPPAPSLDWYVVELAILRVRLTKGMQ